MRNNLTVLYNQDLLGLQSFFSQMGQTRLHFTNGTFTYPAEKVIPTTLAGFQYIKDTAPHLADIFAVAVNSDKSMEDHFDDRYDGEDYNSRIQKFATDLSDHFNDQRQILIMPYDQKTPYQLYNMLSKTQNLELASLHKFGYGTEENGPTIVGRQFFNETIAFALPEDEKPLCHDVTPAGPQNSIKIVDPYTQEGSHGQPYLSYDQDTGLSTPTFIK